MSEIDHKVRYVMTAPDSDNAHICHWPGCDVHVKPAFWGCRKHWFKLPAHLRARVWKAYKPGQEETKTLSQNYLDVMKDVQAWIAANS